MQIWRIRVHSSLQSEIFKVSLWWPFKKMLRNWKQKTDTSQTLKMMTAGQFIKLYITSELSQPWMCVYLPFLSCINKEWIITLWGFKFRTSYCSCALSMCFYGWRGLGPPIVHLPSLRVSMDGGWGFPVVHVPSPCNSMDGGLGLPIVHVPSPCVSMDGV